MAHTSTFVGRDRELAALVDALEVGRPRAATRSHVLLAGDAGVGKTRLLAELGERAAGDGWQVCVGHCLDLGEAALPYVPFAEVLGRLGSTLPDIVDEVVAGFPELGGLRPGRGGPGAGQTDRSSLFDGVRILLESAAAKAPVLLVVEDAHWADASTRDLLTYLLARPFDGPVGVVISYRSDDLHRRHPLRRQASEWSRLPTVSRTVLPPLAEPSVRALVTELAGDEVDAEQREEIVRRAEGNAFFVEELVGAVSGPEHWLPDELADLLLVRFDRLDDRAREVVRTASVSGRRVSHALLATVTGLDDAVLDDALRAAIEAHVLVPLEGRYSFRHALLAEAVYDDLLPGERVRLHRRYVDGLREEPGLSPAAELARHARLAGDRPTALAASIRAGRQALEVGGPDEAARYFETALTLVGAEGESDSGVDLGQLTLEAADAVLQAGRPQRAVDLLAERLARVPSGPGLLRARLLAAKAGAALSLERGEAPLALSADAVAALPADAPALDRARTLATRARVLAMFGHAEEAEAVGLEALATAERHDLRRLASDIVTTLSGLKRPGPQQPVRAALRAAVERASAHGAVHAELRGRYMLGRSLEDFSHFDDAVEWFVGAVRLAEDEGIPWAPYAIDCRWRLLMIAAVRGRWDDVLELAEVPRAPAVAQALFTGTRLEVELARGADPAEISARAEALRTFWAEDGAVAIVSSGVELAAAGRLGDPDAVIGAFDYVTEVLGRIWQPGFTATIRLAAIAIDGLATMLPDRPARERERWLAEVERLHRAGHRVLSDYADPTGHWGPEGMAWAKRLDAETLRARWLVGIDAPPQDELVLAWQETADLCADFGHVYQLATARATYAEILRAIGEPAAAREQAELAGRAAADLGARPLRDRLRPLLGGGRPAAERTSTTLTPREAEILALVAQGRSNGEIGAHLFISTKTVSVHVSRILGKLGASTRTEAAAIARKTGLLT